MHCDPFDIWRQRSDPGLFFCLRGPLSQDLLVEISEVLVRKMRLEGTKAPIVVKVQAVLVELSQNIIRYSAEKALAQDPVDGDVELGSGVLAIARGAGGYSISSGNLIDAQEAPALRSLLDEITGQDAERLRALFLERRRAGSASRRGAGLGLIDVARKASGSLEYQIRPLSPRRAFFSIGVSVKER